MDLKWCNLLHKSLILLLSCYDADQEVKVLHFIKKSRPSDKTKKDQKGETYESVNALFKGRNIVLHALINEMKILIKA